MTGRPERSHGSIVRLLARGALVAVALVVVAWLTVGRIAASKQATVEHAWAGSYGDWDAFLARHPSRDVNDAALEVERHAAELGISIVPKRDGEPRVTVAAGPSRDFGAIRKPLLDWAVAELSRTGGPVSAPPAASAAFLAEHADAFDALREALRGGDVPRWSLHLEHGLATEIPNLNGHITLQRLLAADALAHLHAGERETALRDLEASWTLNAGLRDDPILITQLISVAITRLQLGLLRRVPGAPPEWIARLDEHDYRASFEEALRVEGLLWTRSGGEIHLDDLQNLAGPSGSLFGRTFARLFDVVLTPYERVCVYDHAGRWLGNMERLEKTTLSCDAADDPFLFSGAPGWNVLSRIATPNLADTVERIARLELDLELTGRWLELNEARQRAGAWPSALPGTPESAACPGALYRYGVEDGRAQLTLDVEPRWKQQPGIALPLRVRSGGLPPDGA